MPNRVRIVEVSDSGWAILTADPAPLRELDPDVEVEGLP
jgi:hypothetical protein